MNSDCPPRMDWIRLLDEQLVPDEEAKLRLHLTSCPHCQSEYAALEALTRALTAPLDRDPPTAAAVLARLHEPRALPRRAHTARWVGALGTVAAMAACLALWINRPHGDHFQPRGGGAATLSRQVSVRVYAPLGQPALVDGARVRADVAFTATYRNLRPRAQLLLFGVDAHDQVHWLYPAYLDEHTDPRSVELAQRALETPLSDSAIIDDLPAGPLRLLALITQEPLHVSDIERQRPESLTRDRLTARWPTAAISEWQITVVEPAR